ncbi:MAG: hypothetical protein AB2784_11905, partial [Candidatus Thiodiazotropha endolucinida]
DKLSMRFFLLIDFDMPTLVGILTFMSREKILSMKKFYYLGARFFIQIIILKSFNSALALARLYQCCVCTGHKLHIQRNPYLVAN